MSDSSEGWNGEVVSNTKGGKIRGCTVTKVEGTATEWIIQIDGKDADLGKFSEAIYRKYTAEAKAQSFQGFRPGTIPPHLRGTYAAYTMDECAREATLEAMQQNNVRPFDDARAEFKIESISILPPKKKIKKKKGKRKQSPKSVEADTVVVAEEESKWVTVDTLKEAINAGWKVRFFPFYTGILSRTYIMSNVWLLLPFYANRSCVLLTFNFDHTVLFMDLSLVKPSVLSLLMSKVKNY